LLADLLAYLHKAARTSGILSATCLLHAGVDVDGRDKYLNTALHMAAQEGCVALCVLLLRWGANGWLTDAAGFTAANMAHYAGHLLCGDIIDKWLDKYRGTLQTRGESVSCAVEDSVVAHLPLCEFMPPHTNLSADTGSMQVLIPYDAVLSVADSSSPHPGAGT